MSSRWESASDLYRLHVLYSLRVLTSYAPTNLISAAIGLGLLLPQLQLLLRPRHAHDVRRILAIIYIVFYSATWSFEGDMCTEHFASVKQWSLRRPQYALPIPPIEQGKFADLFIQVRERAPNVVYFSRERVRRWRGSSLAFVFFAVLGWSRSCRRGSLSVVHRTVSRVVVCLTQIDLEGREKPLWMNQWTTYWMDEKLKEFVSKKWGEKSRNRGKLHSSNVLDWPRSLVVVGSLDWRPVTKQIYPLFQNTK